MEKEFDYNQLRNVLENLYGEVLSLSEECPGVCYTSVKPAEVDIFAYEYYIIDKTTETISHEAKAYGQPIEGHPDLLIYPVGESDSGDKIVEYEIYRYRVSHQLPIPKGTSLHGCAVYGAEVYPEYFGMLPVPALTPWGYTTRHRALDNGIYWIETDQCKEVLAVSHPAWASDISQYVLRYAHRLPYDMDHGSNSTFGYQFFSKRASCVVIFELLQTRPEWLTRGNIHLPELMNAIWTYYPEYATGFNAREQSGLNDATGLLLQWLGVDMGLDGSVENMIKLTPDVGVDFLHWS